MSENQLDHPPRSAHRHARGLQATTCATDCGQWYNQIDTTAPHGQQIDWQESIKTRTTPTNVFKPTTILLLILLSRKKKQNTPCVRICVRICVSDSPDRSIAFDLWHPQPIRNPSGVIGDDCVNPSYHTTIGNRDIICVLPWVYHIHYHGMRIHYPSF